MQKKMLTTVSKSALKLIITAFLCLFLFACATTKESGSPEMGEPDFIEASRLNTKLAIGFIQRGQYKAAREKLRKAVKQNSDNFEAFKTMAYLYALLGLTEEAETFYHEALSLNSKDPDLLNSYGTFLCKAGEFNKAQRHFKKAYSNPFYAARFLAKSNAGSCFVKQNKYEKAEPLLRKSLRVNATLPGSLISMAEIGLKTERFLMSRAYIQRYHDVHVASAESLWIQIQAERALGAKEHFMRYARQLINDFPDSDEAGWVELQAKNEQFR